MKEYKNLFFYLITLLVFAVAMYFIIHMGEMLQTANTASATGITVSGSNIYGFLKSLNENLHHPIALLLLQIIAIIIVARIFSIIFKKIGQPSVIGEIVAGIVLGPSVMGYLFPGISAFLFPEESFNNLQLLSQVGLILFMFVVGMEVDFTVLKTKAKDALLISHASIIFPFLLGVGLAYFLYGTYAPGQVSFLSFALFLGIAMSITAFPVLARVIQEKGLQHTRLGTIAITAAAIDDVTAWCILAAVVVIAKAGSFHSALVTISLALVYLFLMIKVIKPYLKKISGIFSTRETMHKWIVALVFIILLVSAYFAEIIGIHTLFGAFLAGVIMPAEINFRKTIIEKVEDVSLVLLLPLFFVLTGLQTQIGLLSSTTHWLVFGLVFLIAITGKFAGSTLAARFTGQNWHDSLSLGALMNTRGLMELVVLTIGYNMGILPPVIFTMLVLMAILTTFMTAPSLYIIHRLFPEHKTETVEVDSNRLSRILISFGPVRSGIKLLRIAGELIDKTNEYAVITALHLTSGTDVNPLKTVEFEDESFNPVREEAGKLGIKLKTKYQVTDNVSKEVFRKVISSKCDLLLIGAGKSPYRGTLIGSLLKSIKTFNPVFLFEWLVKKSHPEQYLIHEKARYILDNAPCSVGVFIDANFIQAKRILLPVLHTSDIAMLPFYNHLISHDKQEIVLIDAVNLSGDYSVFATIKENNNVKMLDIEDFKPELLSHFQLILLSYESWKLIVKYHKNWLDLLPSTLIIKPK